MEGAGYWPGYAPCLLVVLLVLLLVVVFIVGIISHLNEMAPSSVVGTDVLQD